MVLPGLGGSEILIVALIIMVLFGAKKLPELARSLGRSKGEFEKGKAEFEPGRPTSAPLPAPAS